MPFTPTTLDAFTRANNNDLTPDWGADTIGAGGANFSIVSNAAGARNTAYCENHYTGSTPAADAGVLYTITTLPSGSGFSYGGNCRLQTPGSAAADGYRWQQDATTIGIHRLVNGNDTAVLTSAAHTMLAGDKIALIASGSGATVTVKLFRDRSGTQTELLSFGDTDSARITSAGQIGMWAYDPGLTSVFDDFGSAVEVIAPTTIVSPLQSFGPSYAAHRAASI